MKRKSLSIIIPVYNEEGTLHDILENYKKLNPLEIIIVANGCSDKSIEIAKSHKCTVLEFPSPLGHNVGRAIGAKEAKGDIFLFADADFTINPSTLEEFLNPLFLGQADVILNNLNYIFYKKQKPHSTTVWRQITNQFFHRPDLGIDSLVSIPHALTKEVIHIIGADCLANPTLALLKIIQHQFKIHNDLEIDVISPNRYNPAQHLNTPNTLSVSEKRIIGNHVEAISHWLTDLQNPRANYSDGDRRRDILEGLKFKKTSLLPTITLGAEKTSPLYNNKQLSVIIPVQNEEKTIKNIITEARKLAPLEIIVVVNGSTDATEKLAIESGATVISYKEILGNDTGRAIGAYFSRGDILLFIDGDFVISANDLLPFVHAVQQGVDVALNDLEHYLTYRFPLHPVTACKYGINLACNRKDLGIGSTTAVPHALSKKCITGIGFETLASPVVSQIKAILNGYNIKNVHRVEVDKMNRIRPDKHFSENKITLPPSTTRIVGDHIEGISYLIDKLGPRGGF
ncbi:glycosyl transferase [Bacillus cereus]|nr:glycosyl transferase [Bacillus cereus]PGU66179.1 glycosyl transferase [Bacillus cereus]